MKKLIRTRAQAPKPEEIEMQPLKSIYVDLEISPHLIQKFTLEAPLVFNIAPLRINFTSLKFELRPNGLERALSDAKIAYRVLSKSERDKPLNRFWVQPEEDNPLSLKEYGIRNICEKLITSTFTIEMISSLPDEVLMLIEERLNEFAIEAIKIRISGPTVSSLILETNSNVTNLLHFPLAERALAPTPSIVPNSLYLSLT